MYSGQNQDTELSLSLSQLSRTAAASQECLCVCVCLQQVQFLHVQKVRRQLKKADGGRETERERERERLTLSTWKAQPHWVLGEARRQLYFLPTIQPPFSPAELWILRFKLSSGLERLSGPRITWPAWWNNWSTRWNERKAGWRNSYDGPPPAVCGHICGSFQITVLGSEGYKRRILPFLYKKKVGGCLPS